MMRLAVVLTALAASGAIPTLHAQGTGTPLAVGTMAPDFTIDGATRHGVLRDQIKLSDYRGKTVVLAFFFRARTRG